MDCSVYWITIAFITAIGDPNRETVGTARIDPCSYEVTGYVQPKPGGEVFEWEGAINHKGHIFAEDSQGNVYYFLPTGAIDE